MAEHAMALLARCRGLQSVPEGQFTVSHLRGSGQRRSSTPVLLPAPDCPGSTPQHSPATTGNSLAIAAALISAWRRASCRSVTLFLHKTEVCFQPLAAADNKHQNTNPKCRTPTAAAPEPRRAASFAGPGSPVRTLEQSPLGLCGSPVLQVTWKTLRNTRRVPGKGCGRRHGGRGASEDETPRPARGPGLPSLTRHGLQNGNTVLTDFTKVITKHDHEPAADDNTAEETPLTATSGTTPISSEKSTNIYTDVRKTPLSVISYI